MLRYFGISIQFTASKITDLQHTSSHHLQQKMIQLLLLLDTGRTPDQQTDHQLKCLHASAPQKADSRIFRVRAVTPADHSLLLVLLPCG